MNCDGSTREVGKILIYRFREMSAHCDWQTGLIRVNLKVVSSPCWCILFKRMICSLIVGMIHLVRALSWQLRSLCGWLRPTPKACPLWIQSKTCASRIWIWLKASCEWSSLRRTLALSGAFMKPTSKRMWVNVNIMDRCDILNIYWMSFDVFLFYFQFAQIRFNMKLQEECNKLKFLLSDESLALLPEYQHRIEVRSS